MTVVTEKERKKEAHTCTILTSPSRGMVQATVKTGSKKGTTHINISEERGA